MKKVIKIILLIILAVIILIIGGCTVILGIMNHRNENYWKYAEAGGDIEAKYAALGVCDVSYAEFNADGTAWKKYEVWYPSEMKDGDSYPLVVMANGTGIGASKNKAFLKHLASWGFIVIGNEDENSNTGKSTSHTLDFVLSLNEDTNSIFFHKIDTANIGVMGHSQGGVGAINAVTNYDNGKYYKAIYMASCTSKFHAAELGWTYDEAKLTIPCFFIAGTEYWDAGEATMYGDTEHAQGICPLYNMNEIYDNISSSCKVMGRLVGVDHGETNTKGDGYMTAWFMWQLQGDDEAAKAFIGENPEIMNNELYQDQRSDFHE